MSLLIIDRLILESLQKRERTLNELEGDTGLNIGLLMNLLNHLIMKNIVLYKKGVYSLNLENKSSWIPLLKNKDNLKDEVKEIFSSMVNLHFREDKGEQIKLKKIWLTRDEKKMVESKFNEIESFFNQILESRKKLPRKENTCEKEIFVWGVTPYSEVVNNLLDAV
jgi:hypothetical protein